MKKTFLGIALSILSLGIGAHVKDTDSMFEIDEGSTFTLLTSLNVPGRTRLEIGPQAKAACNVSIFSAPQVPYEGAYDHAYEVAAEIIERDVLINKGMFRVIAVRSEIHRERIYFNFNKVEFYSGAPGLLDGVSVVLQNANKNILVLSCVHRHSYSSYDSYIPTIGQMKESLRSFFEVSLREPLIIN
jgi:hypothetical protein